MKKRGSKEKLPKEPEPQVSPEITFDAFFEIAARQGKVKYRQRDEISAFFRDLKLREKEDVVTYESALKKY